MEMQKECRFHLLVLRHHRRILKSLLKTILLGYLRTQKIMHKHISQEYKMMDHIPTNNIFKTLSLIFSQILQEKWNLTWQPKAKNSIEQNYWIRTQSSINWNICLALATSMSSHFKLLTQIMRTIWLHTNATKSKGCQWWHRCTLTIWVYTGKITEHMLKKEERELPQKLQWVFVNSYGNTKCLWIYKTKLLKPWKMAIRILIHGRTSLISLWICQSIILKSLKLEQL